MRSSGTRRYCKFTFRGRVFEISELISERASSAWFTHDVDVLREEPGEQLFFVGFSG